MARITRKREKKVKREKAVRRRSKKATGISQKSFQELEMDILRNAIDRATERKAKQMVKSPEIKKIIEILEDFLKERKLVCYGGTAINNILPEDDRFYNKNLEIPDYDFFSADAMKDAKYLADIYFKAGYDEVEAKSGVHAGTFKVFVNFIPIADITVMDKRIFSNIKRDSIEIDGIHYAPPDFLRMGMYLELSRPDGDTTRWEKILKRLILLNKNYPLKGHTCGKTQFIREFEGSKHVDKKHEHGEIYRIVKDSFIEQGLVFFGGYASTLYSKYMPRSQRRIIRNVPDFDLLSRNPLMSATIVKEQLENNGIKNVRIKVHQGVGEIMPLHYEVLVGLDTIAFIYQPSACHSYNSINIDGNIIRVATIDTILSFYQAFLYTGKPYYDANRLLCMGEFLFNVQAKNRLEQKGLLRRFSINCYGEQKTMEDIRGDKSAKYKELKANKNSKEYQYYFLRYIPREKRKNRPRKTKKTSSQSKEKK